MLEKHGFFFYTVLHFPMKRLATLCGPKALPLFPVLCYFGCHFTILVWNIAEERVRGWPDAVHKYSSYYPVVFQAEDMAEPLLPPVSCSHHDVQNRFAGLVGDGLACNS